MLKAELLAARGLHSTPLSVVAHNSHEIQYLTELTHDKINAWCLQFKPGDNTLNRHQLIDSTMRELLSSKFASRIPPVPDNEWLNEWSHEKFSAELKVMYLFDKSTSSLLMMQKFQSLPMTISVRDLSITDTTVAKMVEIESQTPATEMLRDEHSACNLIVKTKLGRGNSIDRSQTI